MSGLLVHDQTAQDHGVRVALGQVHDRGAVGWQEGGQVDERGDRVRAVLGRLRDDRTDIATAAQVSRPTVYTVGTKPELLKTVRDVAIAGDDEPVAVPDRPAATEALDAPDSESTLRLHARNVAAIHARYADVDEVLRQAAGADDDLARLWEASERQRHDGATIIIDNILTKGPLRPGLTRQQAIDVLWLFMAPDHLRRLRRRNWDDTDYEHWLADTLVDQLLP